MIVRLKKFLDFSLFSFLYLVKLASLPLHNSCASMSGETERGSIGQKGIKDGKKNWS